MDRREFLTLKRKPAVPVTSQPVKLRGITSGLAPYSGAWGAEEISHLLKRTLFGARKADMDHFATLTPSQAVDELLANADPLPAPPVKNYDNTGIDAADPDFSVAQGDTWVNVFSQNGTANYNRAQSLKSWWVGQMLGPSRNIREKMTLFWHNHFATESGVYGQPVFGYRYLNLLRSSASGNFRQLVRDITIDGAMLIYLNGFLSYKDAPDENYARELQELFTLGKENNPNYTENDVKQAARVLTGWRINPADGSIVFNPNDHDTGNKSFSSFYGNTVIAGQSGATAGDQELDALLDMIFSKSAEVSEFIVRKLYRWFCYYVIDADTETNVIKPLAQQFRDGNWEIKPVLETLLKSEHFFDPLNFGAFIKSPVDMVVGMCREFEIPLPPASDYVNAYGMWEFLHEMATRQQQSLCDPPSVSGWPAFYQQPQFYELWINADTLQKRLRLLDQIITSGYTRNGVTLLIDPVAFAKLMPNPGDPNQLIVDSLALLYRVPLSDTSRQTIKQQILLSNQTQDYYWTNAWYAYTANPGDAMAYQTVYIRLRDLYRYLLNLAEYQLC